MAVGAITSRLINRAAHVDDTGPDTTRANNPMNAVSFAFGSVSAATAAASASDGARRLRICHLGKYYPPAPGGMEAHVQTLARAQAALGAKVQVICADHQTGPNSIERDSWVAVVRCRRWSHESGPAEGPAGR